MEIQPMLSSESNQARIIDFERAIKRKGDCINNAQRQTPKWYRYQRSLLSGLNKQLIILKTNTRRVKFTNDLKCEYILM